MHHLRRSPWSVTGAAVALVFIVAVGNLRLAASEVRRLPAEPFSLDDGTLPPEAMATGLGGDADEESVAGQPRQGEPAAVRGQVVPAIYAWDPDVRFVYYRHVSKWM